MFEMSTLGWQPPHELPALHLRRGDLDADPAGTHEDLARDGALIDAGVAEERIYEDLASGRKDHRPELDACLKALQPGNTFIDPRRVSAQA